MSQSDIQIALIKGDGIGVDVSDAALALLDAALQKTGQIRISYREIAAGAGYFRETGRDIETGGEEAAGRADAIFLGAIGLPAIRHPDGTEISPHLRLRDIYQLYAGVRPLRAYPNAPQRLADPRARDIDLVILRESTEGLFYSAAVHGRSEVIDNQEVRDVLRITRATTEKLHRFGFELARKRKERGSPGKLTCVDKANVFTSMAFFRQIYDEIAAGYADIATDYNYVDAQALDLIRRPWEFDVLVTENMFQALDLIRRPWEFDVLVTENMFGDILSDLAGGLVGGMGMAACAEIGDDTGLFQPAHGSAPDIMGTDKANPLAAILSGALMLEYLAQKIDRPALLDAAELIEVAVYQGFAQKRIRPQEFGGDMGTRAVTRELLTLL